MSILDVLFTPMSVLLAFVISVLALTIAILDHPESRLARLANKLVIKLDALVG